MINKEAGNLHIHFTAGLWTNGSNILYFEKKDNVKTYVADGFPFMEINMIYSPKWRLQFEIFKRKGKQLN